MDRTIGVARIGGNSGTNRDPQLFEADRRANWLALTQPRPALPGARPAVSQLKPPVRARPAVSQNARKPKA